MHASSFLALAAATFAAAAPSAPLELTTATGVFNISNFIYGCTAGCNYYFNVTVEGNFPNHPAVSTPVYCNGGWGFWRPGRDAPPVTDYVECGKVSETQRIYAFVDRETSVLNLKYVNNVPEHHAVYTYTGNQTVYAATSTNAHLQKPAFLVVEWREDSEKE